MAKPPKNKAVKKLPSPNCAANSCKSVGLGKTKRKSNPLNTIAKSKQLEDKIKSRKRKSPTLQLHNSVQRESALVSRTLPRFAELERRYTLDCENNRNLNEGISIPTSSAGMEPTPEYHNNDNVEEELPIYYEPDTTRISAPFVDNIELDTSSSEPMNIPEPTSMITTNINCNSSHSFIQKSNHGEGFITQTSTPIIRKPKLRAMPSFIDLEKKYIIDNIHPILHNSEENIVTSSPHLDSNSHPTKSSVRSTEPYETTDGVSQPKRRRLSDSVSCHFTVDRTEERENAGKGSPDSNHTVDYELSIHSPQLNFARSFSPIPSTSNDNAIFQLNEQKLNDSIKLEKKNVSSEDCSRTENKLLDSDDDVEIIEIPCDTIVIDDSMLKNTTIPKPMACQDDSCIIIDCEEPPIPVADKAQPIQNHVIDAFDISMDYTIEEDVSFEDAIAACTHVLQKKTPNINDTITIVEPDESLNPVRNRPRQKQRQKSQEKSTQILNALNNFFNNPQSILVDYSSVDLTNASSSSSQNVATTNATGQINQSSQSIPQPNLSNGQCTPSASQLIPPSNETPGRKIGDCPICMDSLANGPIASTLCGHIFCVECIKAAIRANGKRCPTCRKKLTGKEGFHQLYL